MQVDLAPEWQVLSRLIDVSEIGNCAAVFRLQGLFER